MVTETSQTRTSLHARTVDLGSPTTAILGFVISERGIRSQQIVIKLGEGFRIGLPHVGVKIVSVAVGVYLVCRNKEPARSQPSGVHQQITQVSCSIINQIIVDSA